MSRLNPAVFGLILSCIGTLMLAVGLPALYEELPIPANQEQRALRRIKGNMYGGHESVEAMNRRRTILDDPLTLPIAATAGGSAFFALGMFYIRSPRRQDTSRGQQTNPS